MRRIAHREARVPFIVRRVLYHKARPIDKPATELTQKETKNEKQNAWTPSLVTQGCCQVNAKFEPL